MSVSWESYIARAKLTQAQARLLNFYKKQDEFFPFSAWPAHYRIMALEYKGNRDRFRLYQFLTFNGLPPAIASKWVLAGDVRAVRPNQHISHENLVLDGRYDDNARRQVDRQMPKQVEDGTLFSDKEVFDVAKGRVIRGPTAPKKFYSRE